MILARWFLRVPKLNAQGHCPEYWVVGQIPEEHGALVELRNSRLPRQLECERKGSWLEEAVHGSRAQMSDEFSEGHWPSANLVDTGPGGDICCGMEGGAVMLGWGSMGWGDIGVPPQPPWGILAGWVPQTSIKTPERIHFPLFLLSQARIPITQF